MQFAYGDVKEDGAGIWHYVTSRDCDNIEDAAREAISIRENRVIFFWFDGTPVPIRKCDTPAMVVAHHATWREACQENTGSAVVQRFMLDAGIGTDDIYRAVFHRSAHTKTPQR